MRILPAIVMLSVLASGCVSVPVRRELGSAVTPISVEFDPIHAGQSVVSGVVRIDPRGVAVSENGGFASVVVPGAEQSSELGRPQLPFVKISFYLPIPEGFDYVDYRNSEVVAVSSSERGRYVETARPLGKRVAAQRGVGVLSPYDGQEWPPQWVRAEVRPRGDRMLKCDLYAYLASGTGRDIEVAEEISFSVSVAKSYLRTEALRYRVANGVGRLSGTTVGGDWAHGMAVVAAFPVEYSEEPYVGFRHSAYLADGDEVRVTVDEQDNIDARNDGVRETAGEIALEPVVAKAGVPVVFQTMLLGRDGSLLGTALASFPLNPRTGRPEGVEPASRPAYPSIYDDVDLSSATDSQAAVFRSIYR